VNHAAARLIGRHAPDRAGAGTRLRHRVLVDRRHLRRRRRHRRSPAPPGPLDQLGTPSRHMTGCQPHKPRQAPPVRHDPLAGTSTCTAVRRGSVLRCSGCANHRDPV